MVLPILMSQNHRTISPFLCSPGLRCPLQELSAVHRGQHGHPECSAATPHTVLLCVCLVCWIGPKLCLINSSLCQQYLYIIMLRLISSNSTHKRTDVSITAVRSRRFKLKSSVSLTSALCLCGLTNMAASWCSCVTSDSSYSRLKFCHVCHLSVFDLLHLL